LVSNGTWSRMRTQKLASVDWPIIITCQIHGLRKRCYTCISSFWSRWEWGGRWYVRNVNCTCNAAWVTTYNSSTSLTRLTGSAFQARGDPQCKGRRSWAHRPAPERRTTMDNTPQRVSTTYHWGNSVCVRI
jgi:hypothetical protein